MKTKISESLRKFKKLLIDFLKKLMSVPLIILTMLVILLIIFLAMLIYPFKDCAIVKKYIKLDFQ